MGLKKLQADSYAVVFDVNEVLLCASLVPEVSEAKYTVLGWQVAWFKGHFGNLPSVSEHG